jgi:hypothetical protein
MYMCEISRQNTLDQYTHKKMKDRKIKQLLSRVGTSGGGGREGGHIQWMIYVCV